VTSPEPSGEQSPRRYYVRTYGCQMNEHDSERIAGMLGEQGMEPTDDLEAADVVVLNTCCIRENADNKLYGKLGHLKSKKDARPGLEIIVSGCLAQKDRDLIEQRAGHVDVVVGTHNVHRAVELLHASRERGGTVVEIWDEAMDDAESFPSALAVKREVDYSAWLTIQVGCDNTCAYCIVPSVRGKEISRPFGELVAGVERLAADGVLEVTLLGQNVNSYGRDLTTTRRSAELSPDDAFVAGPRWAADDSRRARALFADLLGAVASVEGIHRVRYTSPHPKDLRAETIAAMADHPAVCNHLHLPLQSGSDATLAAMHRGYTAERYLEKLVAARAGIPDLAVSTDLIVGFPGETDADFRELVEFVDEMRFDRLGAFAYSAAAATSSVRSKSSSDSPGKPTMMSVLTARSSMAARAAPSRSR